MKKVVDASLVPKIVTISPARRTSSKQQLRGRERGRTEAAFASEKER